MPRAPRMDAFTQAYFEAALWSTNDESTEQGGEPLDENYSIGDIDDATRDKMIADCADFQQRFGTLIEDDDSPDIRKHGADELAGYDFWMTRNGHGVGFWEDSDWPKHGEELDRGAKEYGQFDLMVSDGVIYGSPLERTPRRGANEHRMRSPRASSGARATESRHYPNPAPTPHHFVSRRMSERNGPFERGFSEAVRLWKSGVTWESISHDPRYDASAFGRGMYAAIEAMSGWYDVAEREARAHGLSKEEAEQLAYSIGDPSSPNKLREAHGHRVADFSTLPDLIKHAKSDLGATHVSGSGADTRLYFPRGDGQYEEATVWQKGNYWHATGPGARQLVRKPPSGAKPITQTGMRWASEGERSMTEASNHLPERLHTAFNWIDSAGEWQEALAAPSTYAFAAAANARRQGERAVTRHDLIETIEWVQAHPNARGTHGPLLPHFRERTVRDYEATDRNGRTTAGPFKSYDDARQAAGGSGTVKFVPPQRPRPTASEAPRRSAHHRGNRPK